MEGVEFINAVKRIRKDDIIIAFMGPASAGKDTLIDLLTNHQRPQHLDVHQIQVTRIKHPNPKYKDQIILVDTPDFDNNDTNTDVDIASMIKDWLQQTYRNDVSLTGLVYVHSVAGSDMPDSLHQNLPMFGELCGWGKMSQVTLVLTMWDKVQPEVGAAREQELRELFSGPVADNGLYVDRLEEERLEEAWGIVDRLIAEHEKRVVTLLRQKLLRFETQLNKTETGREIYESFHELLLDKEGVVKSLLTQVEESSGPVEKGLREEYAKMKEQFQNTLRKAKELGIRPGRLIMGPFFEWRIKVKYSDIGGVVDLTSTLINIPFVQDHQSAFGELPSSNSDCHEHSGYLSGISNWPQISISNLARNKATRTLIASLTGDNAQCMIDFLNHVVERDGVRACERRQILFLMWKLAKSANVFPGYRDVEESQCDGQSVGDDPGLSDEWQAGSNIEINFQRVYSLLYAGQEEIRKKLSDEADALEYTQRALDSSTLSPLTGKASVAPEEQKCREEEAKEQQCQEASKAVKTMEVEKAGLSKGEGNGVDAPEQDDTTSTPQGEPKEKVEQLSCTNASKPDRKRPIPLDLSGTGSASNSHSSVFTAARVIDDITRISYPEGISSPKPELNANAKNGKFRYDLEFLLQFMTVCKERPNMCPLEAIGLKPVDQASLATRRGSGRHRQGSDSATSSRRGSIGLSPTTPSTLDKSGGLNPFTGGGMGNFSTTSAKLTSEERFQLAKNQSASGLSSNRIRSQRGKQRGDKKMAVQQVTNTHVAESANPEPVASPRITENRWDRKAIQADANSPEAFDRKVRSLLNKLTMERFESLSDQIIERVNGFENRKDERILSRVVRLVFEQITSESMYLALYARLCRKMMEQINNKVQDDGIKNNGGKHIAGGRLFCRYLLDRCQENLERGWATKEAIAAVAEAKAKEDRGIGAAGEKRGENGGGEVVLYSDEYYAAQKAKRQGPGLTQFLGELFKLQMLTERIMHECVKKLLVNVKNPEEEIESLCKLLTTVGQLLDTQKAHAHMDVYFQRMRELTKSPNVSPRMQFMLQDVIELRERKWVSRNAVAAPATIAQIHDTAAKEKAAQEKEYSQRQISMSRGGSRRGGDRSEQPQVNPEGWAVAGNAARPPSKVDLSKISKISKALPTTFGTKHDFRM